ncbi:MAG: FecR domain-containing protein [Paludibacter sp.]|nr:FecR domain-containing protein [Paludibacter sp.]
MYKEYSKYKAFDFLEDDFFIDSMLHPSKENEIFWKKLILSEKVDANEFITAYQILKEIQKNKPEVEERLLDDLWLRIVETNKTKKRKSIFSVPLKYVAAAGLLLVIGVSYFTISRLNTYSKEEITDFARENIIHQHDKNAEIQLVSGQQSLAVEGAQAKVEYDDEGNLKVNKQTVDVKENKSQNEDNPAYNQLIVPYGKRAFLTLSDGSKLWVNTGTTVVYPVTFVKNKREIYVDGEVFAEVTHDRNKPFIVRTDKLDVQVLGTVFNVTAYKEDEQVNVVLVSGSVNVKPEKGKATLIKPNQMYAYTDQSATLRNVDVENYISWKDGIYIFKNEPIEDILLRLSRYYNVTMKLPSSPSGINCSGKLELKDDLNELLNGLSEITSMSYGVKDNEYRIKFQ